MLSKKEWRDREKKVINSLSGFKAVPLSGAGVDHKEDAKSDQWLLQLKSTEKSSISISVAVLAELHKHALTSNRKPVLMIDFVNGSSFFCIQRDDFLLFNKWLEEREATSIQESKQPVKHVEVLPENRSFFDLV